MSRITMSKRKAKTSKCELASGLGAACRAPPQVKVGKLQGTQHISRRTFSSDSSRAGLLVSRSKRVPQHNLPASGQPNVNLSSLQLPSYSECRISGFYFLHFLEWL